MTKAPNPYDPVKHGPPPNPPPPPPVGKFSDIETLFNKINKLESRIIQLECSLRNKKDEDITVYGG